MNTSYFYPDVMVTCDTDDNESEYYTNSPLIIVDEYGQSLPVKMILLLRNFITLIFLLFKNMWLLSKIFVKWKSLEKVKVGNLLFTFLVIKLL